MGGFWGEQVPVSHGCTDVVDRLSCPDEGTMSSFDDEEVVIVITAASSELVLAIEPYGSRCF